MGFTDHDSDLEFRGVTYKAATGFSRTEVDNNSDLSVDNLEIDGVIDSVEITEDDLLDGVYDFAQIEMFIVNYKDLSMGRGLLRSGWTGEIVKQDGTFVAEVRGLLQALQQTKGTMIAPACQADLGDARCKIDLTDPAWTKAFIISSVTDRRSFKVSSMSEADDFYRFGLAAWTSGNNDGLKMEIKSQTGKLITLAEPMPRDIGVNDTITLSAGCDKTKSTCVNKFSNIINFRGFPDLPGIEKIMEYGNK